LNLATAASVGYIVSRDNDLLDLMKDPLFLGRYPRLQIVNPVAFLNLLRSQKTP
jgi:predicted nucleic acid-binding protein